MSASRWVRFVYSHFIPSSLQLPIHSSASKFPIQGKMRVSSLAITVMAVSVVSVNAAATVGQTALAFTRDVDTGRVRQERLLRANTTPKKDTSNEGQEEERGINFSFLDDLIKPKTAEELANAAKKAATNKVYGNLASKVDVRAERFHSWKADGIPPRTIAAQLDSHAREAVIAYSLETLAFSFVKT